MKRDSIHFSVLEDDGYNVPIKFILSPREPGKTTSMTLDKVLAWFKKGLPSVVLVNQAIDIMEEYLASFETTINSFDGYHIETRYKKAGKETCATIKARFSDDEEFRPFVYVIPFSAPLTRLKRLNLGPIGCLWYDECNVNVAIGEKWPADITTKWNELYTTFARACYPRTLNFYATGNYYTRYNPLMIYLGVDCNKLKMGEKTLTHCEKIVLGKKVNYDSLVDCYKLKSELVDYILEHNPGYVFDDTYTKYFLGEAIGDVGVPIDEKQPQNMKLRFVFKLQSRYLYIYSGEVEYRAKYWLRSTDEPPGKRRDVFVADVTQIQSGTILGKAFKNTFTSLKFALSKMDCTFNSNEAYYLMQNIYGIL